MAVDQLIKALMSFQPPYSPFGLPVAGNTVTHAIGDVDAFTVAGGDVLVTLIYGKVVTAGNETITVGNNPTLATATTSVWWTAATINGLGVGDLIGQYNNAGVPTTATALTFTGVLTGQAYIAMTGTIFVRGTLGAGTSDWWLWYIPITAGATIVAI